MALELHTLLIYRVKVVTRHVLFQPNFEHPDDTRCIGCHQGLCAAALTMSPNPGEYAPTTSNSSLFGRYLQLETSIFQYPGIHTLFQLDSHDKNIGQLPSLPAVNSEWIHPRDQHAQSVQIVNRSQESNSGLDSLYLPASGLNASWRNTSPIPILNDNFVDHLTTQGGLQEAYSFDQYIPSKESYTGFHNSTTPQSGLMGGVHTQNVTTSGNLGHIDPRKLSIQIPYQQYYGTSSQADDWSEYPEESNNLFDFCAKIEPSTLDDAIGLQTKAEPSTPDNPFNNVRASSIGSVGHLSKYRDCESPRSAGCVHSTEIQKRHLCALPHEPPSTAKFGGYQPATNENNYSIERPVSSSTTGNLASNTDVNTVQVQSQPRSSRPRRVLARHMEKDSILIKAKSGGMSYREIRHRYNFTEAESTLRGRYRCLIKAKEQRLRRPTWNEVDIKLLREAVRHFSNEILVNSTRTSVGSTKRSFRTGSDAGAVPQHKPTKILWGKVAEYIVENGGTYRFGNTTCRKKWDERLEYSAWYGLGGAAELSLVGSSISTMPSHKDGERAMIYRPRQS